jgi:hypothetical protein
MIFEQYISEIVMLVVGALVGWFPNRKKQRVDVRQIEVDVLEKAIQVLNNDVVEPLTGRFTSLQDDYSKLLKEIRCLKNAINKAYNCRHVADCPIRNELQSGKTESKSRSRIKQPTNRQREPGDGADSEAAGNSEADCTIKASPG